MIFGKGDFKNERRNEPAFLEKSRVDVQMKYAEAYISDNLELQKQCVTFIRKKKSIPSTISMSCQRLQPMAHNTTAFLDQPMCTDFVGFDECRDIIGQFFGPK